MEIETAITKGDSLLAVKIRDHPRRGTETWRFMADGLSYHAVWDPEGRVLITLASPRMRRGQDRRRRKTPPRDAA